MAKRAKADTKADSFKDWVGSQAKELPADVRVLQAELRSMTKRLREARGNADLVVATVREVLDAHGNRIVPIATPKLKGKGRKYEEAAVLHLSDLHFGKVTETFNSAVAAQRIASLTSKLLHITEIRRSMAHIPELHVYLGGDLLEGELIFPGQAHLIDSNLVEQAVHNVPAALAGMLRAALGAFERVVVHCVRGNHGRDSKHAHPATNWDTVACEVTKLTMRADVEAGRLLFNVSPHFYAVDRVFDWGNLVVHGNQVNGGFAGFPWYGVGKKAHGWADAIQEPWDYLYFGHFHTFTSGTLNNRHFLANGTLESDNEYALEQMAAAGPSSQRLAYYTAEHGMIADMQVFVGGERLSQAGKWRRWASRK